MVYAIIKTDNIFNYCFCPANTNYSTYMASLKHGYYITIIEQAGLDRIK